jgi:hypothetical protein
MLYDSFADSWVRADWHNTKSLRLNVRSRLDYYLKIDIFYLSVLGPCGGTIAMYKWNS